MTIGKIDNLSYSYTGETEALHSVSFEIEEGEYLCLLGHNGSGKSTLAKCLMGLLTDFEGEITLFGLKLDRRNLRDIRSRVGIVFQNPDNQFVGSTVADDIAFGLENKRVPHEEMDGIIKEYAEKTGMTDYLEHEPSSLSGGQKQRVAIAGVLALSPDLIIFDEATSMLDPKGKRDILDLVFSLRHNDRSTTIVSITHDVEEAALADKVIVLNEGKIALSGKPDEVFSDIETLHSLRLAAPFVYELKHELKKRRIEVPDGVKDIQTLEEFLCR